jgi:hypothetical protein
VANKQSKKYSNLLSDLYSEDFVIVIERDINRSIDGTNLRFQYADEHSYMDILDILEAPCSVLEMMIALALRYKNSTLYGYNYDVSDIFWDMIDNMGLKDQTDNNYDSDKVLDAIDILVDREYGYDGSGGGLFIVPNPRHDMRDTELWFQINWYYAPKIMKGELK